MSLFPQAFVGSQPATGFTPLFRLLDDFDNYSRAARPTKTFSPKFDVTEQPESYTLHGEFPGIDQKDVEIEFTEPQTITIRGRTERSYTSGTPPAAVEDKSAATITDGSETSSNHAHQPTVEDEDTPVNTPATTVAEPVQQQEQQPQEPQEKFWVSERSVGQFSRSFSFPVRVEQDAVKASMKNGILSIVVPKAKKPESRRIRID